MTAATVYTDSNRTTTDESAVQTDLIATMKQLYETNIRGNISTTGNTQHIPVSLSNVGVLAQSNLSTTNKAVDNKIFVNVLTREKFEQYAPTTTSFSNVNLASNLYVNTGALIAETSNIVYTQLSVDADIPADSNLATSDINAYDLMVASGFTRLAGELRQLKIAYQLLDDDIFQNLISASGSNGDGSLAQFPNLGYYRIYDMKMKAVVGGWRARVVNDSADYADDTAGYTSDLSTFDATDSIIQFVRTIDPATQDIFVIRRLILGTYLAAHVQFFTSVFFNKRKNTPGTVDLPSTLAAKIAFYYYEKLRRLNTTYESSRISPSSTVNDTVRSAMADNVKQYNENSSRLSDLHKEIDEKKRFLSNETARVKVESANADYATKLKIITVSFAVVFAAAMLVVMMLPFEFKARMKIAGIVAGFVIIFAIVLSVIVRRVDPIEGFETPVGTAALAMTTEQMNNFDKLVNLLLMEELRNFYRYTVDITAALKNNRLYGELNYNSGKERNYFENGQYQLNKAVTDTHNAQRLFDRKTKISTATIRLFLQLVVIVSFVLLGIMAVQDTVPGLLPVIYTIGGILAVLAFIIFFGEILGRTRTDADKMYWGTPQAVKDL